jgi:hypothetical protein
VFILRDDDCHDFQLSISVLWRIVTVITEITEITVGTTLDARTLIVLSPCDDRDYFNRVLLDGRVVLVSDRVLESFFQEVPRE